MLIRVFNGTASELVELTYVAGVGFQTKTWNPVGGEPVKATNADMAAALEAHADTIGASTLTTNPIA
jgi:hypothetical protein